MTGAGRRWAVAAIVAVVATVVAWQREPAAPAAAAAETQVEVAVETAVSVEAVPPTLDGAALFRAKGCAACHAGPESAAAINGAFPSLASAPYWAGDRRPDLSAAEYLAQSIREPWAFTSPEFTPGAAGPTTAMPALELTGAEIDAIVEYLLAG